MEILRFLINFFLEEYGGKDFAPVLESLSNGSLDFKSLLSNIKPETIAPILKRFINLNDKDSPTENGRAYGLNPISNFADGEIVRSLNNFFSD